MLRRAASARVLTLTSFTNVREGVGARRLPVFLHPAHCPLFSLLEVPSLSQGDCGLLSWPAPELDINNVYCDPRRPSPGVLNFENYFELYVGVFSLSVYKYALDRLLALLPLTLSEVCVETRPFLRVV